MNNAKVGGLINKYAVVKHPTPKELDRQSGVHIDKWIDIDSPECIELDDGYRDFTKQCIRFGFESGHMFCDTDGRIWGGVKGGLYFPFHFEAGTKLYGYKFSKKAAN